MITRRLFLSAPTAFVGLVFSVLTSPAAAQSRENVPPAQISSAPMQKDELPNAGYVPGYRSLATLGMSPYAPRVGAMPGGMTPGFRAPTPASEWTFNWSGFLTASLQFSKNERLLPGEGQSRAVFHVPPQTVDEYGSFVGTSTMPGQWAQMAFVYGNPSVSANVTLTTWNPSEPTTYYQIGSEQFINNAYLAFNRFPVGPLNLRAMVGYFYNIYGNVGRYGMGMYTNAFVGNVRGVGENLIGEFDIGNSITVAIEHGIMASRNGMGAINVIPTGQNGTGNPIWPASWIHHAHLGFEVRGEPGLRVRLHYVANWSQDERVQRAVDNPVTRQIDESYVKDGRITIYGVDAGINSSVYGYLGAAAAFVQGRDAYPLKGVMTFGGDGESLTNRWWGVPGGGNGKLLAAGINYGASIGRIVSYPVPFSTNGPDLTVQAGFVIAKAWTDFEPFSGRLRHKYGVDLLYTFLPFMGAGVRADRVVPSSKDAGETFHVVAPRLIFKTDWNSRETITLLYAKWFYGRHTHPEASSITPGERLDEHLFALNVQMWW